MGKVDAALADRDFKRALKIVDHRIESETDADQKALLLTFLGLIHLSSSETNKARSDFAQAVGTAADPSAVLDAQVTLITPLNPILASEALKRLAALDPAAARQIDPNIVGQLLRFTKKSGGTDIYYPLLFTIADLGFGSVDERDSIALEAATVSQSRGEVARALQFAKSVSSRASLVQVLTERRFAALWPELERSVGPKMEIPAQRNLAIAQATFDADPSDPQARLELMQAHIDLKQWQAVDSLGKDIGRSRAELMAIDSETMWLIDTHAVALKMMNRRDEGDRRRAALVETWSPTRRWIVSSAINRIEDLLGAGRFAEALALTESSVERVKRDGNAYAEQILRSARIEALVRLGRMGEANKLTDDLLAHANNAPARSLMALLQVDRRDDAEKAALGWLSQPDRASRIIALLREDDSWLGLRDDVDEKLIAAFRARPAIAAAFSALARDLPEQFRVVY